MQRRFPWLAAVFAFTLTLLFSGCESVSKKDYPMTVPRFMLESIGDEVGINVRLPISGVVVRVSPKTIITEYDIVRAELVQSDFGPAVMFQLSSDAGRDLYRISATNLGRRILTTINGQVMAIGKMDRPFADGVIISYPEVPAADLPELIKNINKTCADLQKELAKKK